jgi:hypothetical protein
MTVKGIGPVTVHAHRPYFHSRDFCEHWQLCARWNKAQIKYLDLA